MADDVRDSLAAIRAEQVEIRAELALQTADLEEIRTTQGGILGTLDRRFDIIENGHDRLAGEIHDGVTSMAVELGRVSARQERIE